MSRPLSFVLAAALLASSMTLSAAPAAAHDFNMVTSRSGEWNDNWRGGDRRWRPQRHSRFQGHFAPGFSLSFGVPVPYAYGDVPRRDCRRDWDGRLYCRAY